MPSNSLRIVNADGSINEGGYIAVVRDIVFDADKLEDFVGEDDEGAKFKKLRTKQLRKAANSAGGTLQQLNDQGAPEDVTPQNCRIRAQLDVRKDSPQGFSKITVSMPEAALAVADLDYIDRYVTKFLQIRTASAATQLPAAASAADARHARMFMFGAFMLTKCR